MTEKNPKKMKIFDYIFESSIRSSKTIINIMTELMVLAESIDSINQSLLNLTKVIQVHQNVLDDICKALEQASEAQKKSDYFPPQDIKKKDKPN